MRCVSSACTKKREHGSGGPSTYTRPTEKWRATRLRRRSLRRSAAGTTSAHRKRWVWRTAFRIAAGELKRRRNEHGLWTHASYEIADETAELLAALPRDLTEAARRDRSPSSRRVLAQGGLNGGECIHPRRARSLAHALRSIRRGIFAGYSALESRFNQAIRSGMIALTWGLALVVPTGFEPVSPP